MEQLIINNRPFMNKLLQKATDQIRKYDGDIRTNQLAIAHIMGRVDTNNLYSDDGYESAVAWAMDAFRIKKTTAYNLITLGKEWVQEVRDSKGKLIGYASNIVAVKDTMPLVDFTANQLGRLSTLGHDVVKRYYDAGVISPNMTAKEIQDFIRQTKAISKEAEQQEQTTTAQEPDKEVYALVDHGRDAGWDNASTNELVAELVKRGFDVYRDGTHYIIKWPDIGD